MTSQCVTALRLFFSVTAIFFPVHRVAADGRVDRAGILTQIAADDALIRPGKAVILELRSKMRVRKVVFRGDEQAGCVLVDAVDDAGPLLTADTGERIAAVVGSAR